MSVFKFSPRWPDIARTWEDEDTSRIWRAAIELLDQRDRDLEDYLRRIQPSWTATNIADHTVGVANTWEDWGSAVTIAGSPKYNYNVTVFGLVLGYVADFTAISAHQVRVGIATDGSTYAFGRSTREVSGQGGNNYNSQNHGAAGLVTGTPTGNILVKAQVQSTTTTTTATNGALIVAVIPAP